MKTQRLKLVAGCLCPSLLIQGKALPMPKKPSKGYALASFQKLKRFEMLLVRKKFIEVSV
jgi:hypothetical protein